MTDVNEVVRGVIIWSLEEECKKKDTEIERLRGREQLMRELLRFYAQNDPAIGMCGYDQSYTCRGDGCLIKAWEGEVLEDAGRKAQLLLLDMFGETGAWRDEATAREVLKGVSYFIERIEPQEKAMAKDWTEQKAIELLENEVKRLREALQLIVDHPVAQSGQWFFGVKEIKNVARAALEKNDD